MENSKIPEQIEHMKRSELLEQICKDSLLSEVLELRKQDDKSNHSSWRFKTNEFRIRAIEVWEGDGSDGRFFRIYHALEIPSEIKSGIDALPNRFRSNSTTSDFHGDFFLVAKGFHALLKSDMAIAAAKQNPVVSRRRGYEGLVLPDVDVSDPEIFGRTFTWRELLAIEQDISDSPLKENLSKCGVYLQRSVNGTSRYVGAAYGEGGFLARWLSHLGNNGAAKHLNFFVLENGYSNVVFAVLEITSKEGARDAEARWKQILGSNNDGPYDGFRLNCN